MPRQTFLLVELQLDLRPLLTGESLEEACGRLDHLGRDVRVLVGSDKREL